MTRLPRIAATLLALEAYVVAGLLMAWGFAEVWGSGDLLRALVEEAALGVAFAGFPVVGWLILVRRPENRIGWVVLLIGVTLYNAVAVMELADRGFRSGSLSDGLVAVVSIWNAVLPAMVIGLFVWFLVLFPGGDPDRRGRLLGRASVLFGVVVVLSRLLRPGRLDLSEDVDVANAFGIEGLAWLGAVVALATLGLVIVALVAFGRLVRRYRVADRTTRKQVQWVISPLGAFVVFFVLGLAFSEIGWLSDFETSLVIMSGFLIGFLGMAVGIGVAVFRYRLYEIDRIVSRTVGYTLAVAILLGLYTASVLGLGAAARALTGESGDLVVALSTLFVAAAFRPVGSRVRRQVDRRFDRARYDAARTADEFAHQLRDEVEVARLEETVRRAVADVLAPRSVALWVKEGGG